MINIKKARGRIRPIMHNNKEIIYTDWKGFLDPVEFRDAIWSTSEWIVQYGKYDLLEIVDMRGSFFDLEIFEVLKKAAAQTRMFSRKKAVVADFSDSRLLMLRLLNTFAKEKIEPFRDLEKAKDWIVGE